MSGKKLAKDTEAVEGMSSIRQNIPDYLTAYKQTASGARFEANDSLSLPQL